MDRSSRPYPEIRRPLVLAHVIVRGDSGARGTYIKQIRDFGIFPMVAVDFQRKRLLSE